MVIENNAKDLVKHQIFSFFGGVDNYDQIIDWAYPIVLNKLEYCFSYVKNKYYRRGEQVFFNPLHVGQWTMFLYYMGNVISKRGERDLCDKLYGISKVISSADIFYEINMPDIWFFDHPQGAVMGRANYDDFFSFGQGCTVGNNKGVFPIFGKHVSMFSDSKVLGACRIGDHVIFAANAYVLDTDIPSYSIVFGQSPNITIHSIDQAKFNEITESVFYCDE